ncbi:MAG: sulfotransferase [Gemmatimonadaceae bacterium]
MSNLVFVTGDFCSGSTLLFTLFRKTNEFYCLYEPLHDSLPEFLIYGLRPDPQDHHFFADPYYEEFKGFSHARALHSTKWGRSNFHIAPDEDADDLYRYINYLVGSAFGRAPRVMFKENRLPFRLGWIRAKFPSAKIVHIHRPKEDQWKSVVRRVQMHHGREDVGQGNVGFTGFSINTWCEDLKHVYPQLDAKNFTNGFDRFSALWQLSFDANRAHADISIDYRDLQRDFVRTADRMWDCLGVTTIDSKSLERYVVRQEGKASAARRGLATRARDLIDRAGRTYARVRVRAENRWRAERDV